MVWVKFLSDFTFKPTQQVSIDYPAGAHSNVTAACANEAIAAGAAVEEAPDRATKARAKAAEAAADGTENADS